MGIQLTLAARYLAGRRLRALLTTLAVVFGVLVIFGMNILVPTLMQAFQATMLAASDQVDMTISHRSGEGFPPAVLAEVRAVDGIRAAQGLLSRPLNLPADFLDHDPAKADRVAVLSLTGLDPGEAQTVRSYAVRQGRFLEPGDTDAAVISQSLADASGRSLGGAFPLPTAQGLVRLTVVGIRAPRTVLGNEEVLVTLGEAQRLLDAPGQINTIEANMASSDQGRRTEIERAVQARLGDGYTLGTLSSLGQLSTAIQAARVAFSVFGALALFMGAFIIFNTFRTIVAERRRDIGMLRAVGASRRTIVGVILVEGLLQGAAGTALGMVLGWGLAAGSTAAMGSLLGQYIHVTVGLPVVTPGIVAVTVLLGVGVTLAAGLFPALAAGRLTPMEALRPSGRTEPWRRRLGPAAVVGIALIVAAAVALASGNVAYLALGSLAFLAGLILVAPSLVRPLALAFGALVATVMARGGTGRIAQGNIVREPSRAAVTASTSMIALAIIVALGGVTASLTSSFLGILKSSLGSDYLFVPPAVAVWQNNVGAQSGLADRLRRIDGVGPVSTFRFAAGVVDAPPLTFSLLGIDPVTFPQVSALAFDSGSPGRVWEELAGGRTMIANPILAAAGGLRVGAEVPLLTPEGPRSYRVIAIAGDFLNIKVNTAYISQATMARDFHKTEDVFIQLNLAPGADAAAVGAAIREAGRDYPQFTVIDGSSYYREMSSMFTTALSAIYLLFLFLAIPSLITMINTLAIGVIERTREIGMLRAVGTTRAQVRRIVLAEALLLAAIGTAFGLAAGMYLGYLLVEATASVGFPMHYVFPWVGIASAVAVGLAFGALAAVVPARKASGLQIVEALRFE